MQDTLSIFDTLLVRPSSPVSITHGLNDSLLRILHDCICGSHLDLMDLIAPLATIVAAFIGGYAIIKSNREALRKNTQDFVLVNKLNQVTILADKIRDVAANHAAAVTEYYHSGRNNLLRYHQAESQLQNAVAQYESVPADKKADAYNALNLGKLYANYERLVKDIMDRNEPIQTTLNVTRTQLQLLLDERQPITKKLLEVLNRLTDLVGNMQSVNQEEGEEIGDTMKRFDAIGPDLFDTIQDFQSGLKVYVEILFQAAQKV